MSKGEDKLYNIQSTIIYYDKWLLQIDNEYICIGNSGELWFAISILAVISLNMFYSSTNKLQIVAIIFSYRLPTNNQRL